MKLENMDGLLSVAVVYTFFKHPELFLFLKPLIVLMSHIHYQREILVSLFSKTNNSSVDLWVQRVNESFLDRQDLLYTKYILLAKPRRFFTLFSFSRRRFEF